MARRARVSPERILAAAALEFAARGYAGARVDRIARRARVNKAMLYYHFKSKEELYRTLLRQTFTQAGERLRAIAQSEAAPADKLDRVIEAVAGFVRDYSFFPAIMLREIAEGGARLDRSTLGALATLPAAFGAVVGQGIAAGTFRAVHPMAAYFSVFAPIVFFLAGSAIRRELTEQHLVKDAAMAPEAFVAYMQESMRRALSADFEPAAPQGRRRSS
ncbi:MAG: TetR/AcrR family transcriptional regulator [Vicinamibacterales bacterium]